MGVTGYQQRYRISGHCDELHKREGDNVQKNYIILWNSHIIEVSLTECTVDIFLYTVTLSCFFYELFKLLFLSFVIYFRPTQQKTFEGFLNFESGLVTMASSSS